MTARLLVVLQILFALCVSFFTLATRYFCLTYSRALFRRGGAIGRPPTSANVNIHFVLAW